MTVDLIRVDERLLHGQVVVGWGERLDLRWYVVADDDLAASEWEQGVYRSGLPEGVEVIFLAVDEAAGRLPELDRRAAAGCVLLPGTAALRRLAEAGALEGRAVNLGCLGAAPGRREALTYLHLSPREAEDLRAAAERGAEISARDVPTARRVPLEEVLEAAGGD